MTEMDPQVANDVFGATLASNEMNTPRSIGKRCRRAHEGEEA
jgi:hypothetical protein